METMKIKVHNRSSHAFTYKGHWIDGEDHPAKMTISGGEEKVIGEIPIPSAMLNPNGNWGWWYVEDSTNRATFEFFAYAHPKEHSGDQALAGLRANGSHKRDHPLGPTPNPLPEYLDTAQDDTSFTLIIKEKWTSSPPDWIFNYGHYFLDVPSPLPQDTAAHAYVRAVPFDGGKTIDFECYGGTSGRENRYPALSFIASEDQLRLARIICCFDSKDKRDSYARKPKLSPELAFTGELLLGDCCGIVYLYSGVCHQMANRICAAVTDLDVGDLADMSLYNLTHQLWGKDGKAILSEISESEGKLVHKAFSRQAAFTDAHLQALRAKLAVDKSHPADLLFRPWEEYLARCKQLAQE